MLFFVEIMIMFWLIEQHMQHLQIVALLVLKAIRVDCWHQVKVHTIHNVCSSCIGCVVLAQPLCQSKQQLPAMECQAKEHSMFPK